MFDIGFWELTIIGVVALLVIGPEKLPQVARTAGLWLGKARRFVSSVKADIDREIAADELKKTLARQAQAPELYEIAEETRQVMQDLQHQPDNDDSDPLTHEKPVVAHKPNDTKG